MAALLFIPLAAGASTSSIASGHLAGLVPRPDVTNVSYTSSVDGFTLSYLEYLPAGYNGSNPYPLAVYLHGAGASTTNVSGGTGGITAPGTLIANASTSSFILISINTRSSAGFYLNSPCGGPQATDVVDAVNHEKGLRSVGKLYLVGFSAGSNGALMLAGHALLTVSGIGTAGTITDFFETFAYNIGRGDVGHYNTWITDECGKGVGPSNLTQVRTVSYMSVFRFHPENFSSVRMFMAAGGLDTQAPNNYVQWPYANLNSTALTATCTTVSSLGEPANCTRPFANISGIQPFLSLYEPTATHSNTQIQYAAMFQFFLGTQAGGFYTTTFPPKTLTAVSFSWTGGGSAGGGGGGGAPPIVIPPPGSSLPRPPSAPPAWTLPQFTLGGLPGLFYAALGVAVVGGVGLAIGPKHWGFVLVLLSAVVVAVAVVVSVPHGSGIVGMARSTGVLFAVVPCWLF